MRRSTSRTYTSWIPTVFALMVSVAVIGRWALTIDGSLRVAAVVLLGALVPIAVVAGAYAAQRPLNRRIGELEAVLDKEQDERRSHDEIYGRFINELRAPLTAVYGFSRHLDDSGIANISEAEELIGIISHDATEVVRKVENIATAAQIEAGVYRPVPTAVDLGTHVGRIVEVIGRSRISISVDAQPTIAWCDPTAVRQILVNLVTSPVKPVRPRSASTSTNETDSGSSRSPTTGFAMTPMSPPLGVCSGPPVRCRAASFLPSLSIRGRR